MKTPRPNGRPGFTLVEMMVSVALCMFIMVILAGAFDNGIQVFRQLRSAGQMAEKLRGASAVIRKDLASPHFAGAFQPGLSGPYLSDQRLDLIGWMPPQQGYFQIYAPPVSYEGADGDGVPSTVSPPPYTIQTGVNPPQAAMMHRMSMTVQLSGTTAADCFQAALAAPASTTSPTYPTWSALNAKSMLELSSAGVFTSRWGQVNYYLADMGESANGRALYTLYRRQTAVLPDAAVMNGTGTAKYTAAELAQNSAGTSYLSPTELTLPSFGAQGNRQFATPGQTGSPLTGTATPNAANFQPSTIDSPLLHGVISFEIRAWWDSMTVTDPTVTNSLSFPLHSNFVRANPATSLTTAATGQNAASTIPTALPKIGTGTADTVTPNISNIHFQNDASYNTPFRELPRFCFRPLHRQNGAFYFRDLPGTLNTATLSGTKTPVVAGGYATNDPNYANLYESTSANANAMAYSYTFDTWTQTSVAATRLQNIQYINWSDPNLLPPAGGTPYAPGDPTTTAFPAKGTNNVPLTPLVPWDDRPPMRIRIRAIQIKLRIWDAKVGQARQVTIIQDV